LDKTTNKKISWKSTPFLSKERFTTSVVVSTIVSGAIVPGDRYLPHFQRSVRAAENRAACGRIVWLSLPLVTSWREKCRVSFTSLMTMHHFERLSNAD
jgi:hypothetical protein